MANHIIYGCGYRWGWCTKKNQPHTCNRSVRVNKEVYETAKKKSYKEFMLFVNNLCSGHRCKDCNS